MTREERLLRIESLRASLQQARQVLTAEPNDANLRVVERLRGELASALKARSVRERAAERRRERSGL